MTSAPRLQEIEIENFRGFAAKQTLPLDADVVLISGGNGTGKTSLTDAITWNLTGQLPGLAGRLKGERKGEDYVRSYYGSGTASVRLRVMIANEAWDIERRGDASGSELHIAPSPGATSRAELQLANMFGFEQPELLAVGVHAWGVLRQDSMRATLEQGSEALHRRLREILGLSALAEFEAATRDTATALTREADQARTELDRALAELSTAKRDLLAAEESDARRGTVQTAAVARLDRLSASAIAGVRVTLPSNVDSAELATLSAEVSELIRAALDITQQLATAPIPPDIPSTQTLEEMRASREAASRELDGLEARHSAQLRLAEAALQLLSITARCARSRSTRTTSARA